jgi:hypothetical protein
MFYTHDLYEGGHRCLQPLLLLPLLPLLLLLLLLQDKRGAQETCVCVHGREAVSTCMFYVFVVCMTAMCVRTHMCTQHHHTMLHPMQVLLHWPKLCLIKVFVYVCVCIVSVRECDCTRISMGMHDT